MKPVINQRLLKNIVFLLFISLLFITKCFAQFEQQPIMFKKVNSMNAHIIEWKSECKNCLFEVKKTDNGHFWKSIAVIESSDEELYQHQVIAESGIFKIDVYEIGNNKALFSSTLCSPHIQTKLKNLYILDDTIYLKGWGNVIDVKIIIDDVLEKRFIMLDSKIHQFNIKKDTKRIQVIVNGYPYYFIK